MCTTCGCGPEEHHHDHGHDHDHHHDGNGHRHHHHHDHGEHRHGEGGETKRIAVETDILAKNDRLAAGNRALFREKGVFALNLVSSPGSGKTPILERYCQEMGRDPKSIKRSAAFPMVYTDDPAQANKVVETIARRRGMSVEQARERLFYGNADMVEKQVRDFMGVGVTHIIIQVSNPEHMQGVVRLAREVMPRFKSGQK